MAQSHLARVAYTSTLRRELSRRELDPLLSAWRRRNAGRAVTGFLLCQGDSVFQVLEGFPDVIAALYATISQDPLHHQVTQLIDEPIAERSFGDRSMGRGRVAGTEPGARAPLCALLDPAVRRGHSDEAMARGLISRFTTGPWRRSIC